MADPVTPREPTGDERVMRAVALSVVDGSPTFSVDWRERLGAEIRSAELAAARRARERCVAEVQKHAAWWDGAAAAAAARAYREYCEGCAKAVRQGAFNAAMLTDDELLGGA